MFKKILIANRGEIACRVMRTAHKMGITPVAVYSEPDAQALHVRTALELGGEAVAVGPAASSESYLVIDKIVEACKQTGAEAVHPGYGFLSENKAFAARLEKEGITFIGPPVGAIEAMGDKIESKKLAQAAGVSTVPGYLDAVRDPEEAVRISKEIGYPVMLKASAGGGGKGMRLAWNDDEARSGLVSAMNEGRNSFGDDRVFIEKFVQEPRHIEIQVMADGYGNCVYLGERECSIQRRHQKVIEEAPSPFLDEATRKAMGEQAVALAQQVNYKTAGTVEFIVDKDRDFYFLEMNTRLQVEHPVTELVTGYDLVELMIRVAHGEKLPFTQKDVTLTGWAMEARLYAEDAERGFLPSTGRLTRYIEPAPVENTVRVDSGCYEGAEISMFYDPMISKLIVGGKDRAEAIENMRKAIDGYVVRGLSHNMPFLANLVKHPRFGEGRITTNFIAEEYPEGLTEDHLKPTDLGLFAAVAAVVQDKIEARERRLSGQEENRAPDLPSDYAVFLGDKDLEEVALHLARGEDCHRLTVDGREIFVESDWKPGFAIFKARIDDVERLFQVDKDGAGFVLSHDGARIRALVLEARHAPLRRLMPYKPPPDMSKFLLSPMPGLLVRLTVKEGDIVEAGSELAVVEAMKMENVLRAGAGGTVRIAHAKEGDSLAVDQPILEFE
ncbi:acetyl/propionyl/methylcrotonyl-CoA carboxylase subunit alpha [Rhodospirillaceae bacterium KN72]|uniref:Acetyl/propionyl/methylcrotonyl-CoA carboxylase subunit alpha n=1 Tax=Pacificispira spongiicola TaxID=2729598 RepID=A0A7Y0HHD9_9PROT|nr:acetyl/propionyl/methylcrotonyl-CoA carboxylase subunit alpha [Pacificispira spongiicola]NMM46613.1 acetyl/propionyl/methylcrotonyl-CoA carboxylase subunit alpha [Pacificispira spongiicola]